MPEPINPLALQQLVDEYREHSLYQALRFAVTKLQAAANAPEEDASDPYRVMRLRGRVEACEKILSEGFLIALATQVLVAKVSREEPAEEQRRTVGDRGWWMPENDLVQ